MDTQKIFDAPLELIIDLYEWIKDRQYRFIIEGEDGYSGGVYVIKILGPFHDTVVKHVRSFEFNKEGDQPDLIGVMKEALVKLLEKEPDFFRTYEMINRANKNK
jgi:hypothetical protein